MWNPPSVGGKAVIRCWLCLDSITTAWLTVLRLVREQVAAPHPKIAVLEVTIHGEFRERPMPPKFLGVMLGEAIHLRQFVQKLLDVKRLAGVDTPLAPGDLLVCCVLRR